MKIRLGDIANEQALRAYTKVLRCEPESARAKFKLLQIDNELAPIIANFQEVRKGLLEKHGQPHPENLQTYHFPKLGKDGEPVREGDTYARDDERIEAYMAALDELYNETVEVSQFIDLDFVDRNIELSTQELGLLAWLVEECHEIYGQE